MIEENREEIARISLEFSDKYPLSCPDPSMLIPIFIRLLYQGFKLSDLTSGNFDGIIIDQYKLDAKEQDQKMQNLKKR